MNPRCLRTEGHYRLDSGRAVAEGAGSNDGVGHEWGGRYDRGSERR